MSCVIFGAGKIARGFVGHLLFMSKSISFSLRRWMHWQT